MPEITWSEVFHPVWEPGGLSATTRAVTSRLLDDFDAYATDAAAQAVWSLSGAGGGDAIVLSSVANALKGQRSLEITLTGGPAVVSRTFNRNYFHYAAGGEIRYVTFRGLVTAAGAPSTIRVRLGNSADTIYKEWSFVLDSSTTREMYIDMYSGGEGYQNTESNPGPIATLGTWNPAVVNKISFTSLENGKIYRLDDIRFSYDGGNSSLLDLLGFGTEPATDDGADGSIQSKIRKLSLQVQQLVGTTEQYSKSQPHTAYLNNAYTFGLELKGFAEQGIPSTTEIVPGNYTIERVRNGTTTEIVASTGASESAGFIFATYTPLEDNWQPGDEIIVTFSGGSVYNDTDSAALLTANAAAAQAVITVANAALFQVGQHVRLYDDTPDTEWLTVLTIDSPTQLTFSTNLVNNYTTAANAAVILAEQTILETARLIANVTYEPELSKDLLRWVLADYDDFDFADADGNNERWDVGYITNSDGSAAGAEGGSADINTTTAGQARVSVDPDATPTHATYALKRDEPSYSRYFSTVVDADITLNAGQVTATFAGLRVSAGDIDDPSNYVLIAREVTSAVNRITARAEFAGVVQSTVTAAITDNALAFKIERYGNVWNVFYSLTQFPNHQWVKVTQFEDASGDMTSKASIYLYAESEGSADAQTAIADFDNWRYFIGSGAIDQLLSTSILASGTFTTSSVTVPADTGRTEGNDYWNGAILMPVTGVVAFQPRLISDFANAGGVFTIPSSRPFTSAPAVGDEYVILVYQGVVNPALNTTTDQTTWDVVGTKADTTVPTPSTTASLAGYNKALVARGMGVIQGTVTSEEAGLQTTQFYSTDLIGFGNDFFNEEFSLQVVYTTDGAAPLGETRDITDYVSADGHFTVGSIFSAAVNIGDKFAALHKTQLLLIPTIDTSDPVDMTAEVPDNSVLAQVLTDDGDSSVYDRRRMSLEAITNALQIVNPAGVGFEGDGTGATLYKTLIAIEGVTSGAGTTSTFVDAARVEGLNYWNGNMVVALSGATVGQVRTIVVDDGAGTLTVEPLLSAAPGTPVTYVILNLKNADWIVGADNANNAFASSNVIGNVDGSVLERVEAVQAGLGVVAGGGTGFEADGTGTSAYDAIVGVNEAVWMDGTVQQALSDMPFVQGVLHVQQSPRVDQDSQIVATLSLHNLRPDSDVIQTTEYSGATITIARYRQGVDADWTNIVVAAAMTEAAGQATYSYTFTSASWVAGDSIRYTIQSCVVEIPTASGQIYTLPTTTGYGVTLASSASSNALALPVFAEFWDTETIEADVWTVTTPATGTLAIDAAEAGYMKVRISPNANEVGRLVSDFRIRIAPDQVGINSIVKKLVVEFEAKFTNIANIDNTISFFGLSATTAAIRTTNSIAAFTLTGDALFATTDDAAIENDAAAGAPTLTNWNKFRIEAYAGAVDFYVNEVRTNNFVANLPDQMMYFNFYLDTEAGGAGTFDLGPVRYWYEDTN